jgi:predicted nucleotidyltransferase component of viral defense system
MSNPDFLHARPEEFKAAVQYTTADTGFQPQLIEKDYFCSLVLRALAGRKALPLVFKGGTLLNKAYSGFYRLSEDLDFTISTGPDVKRSERSRIATLLDRTLEEICAEIPGLEISEPLKGFNNSTQHRAKFVYPSVDGEKGAIQLEVGQRERVMLPVDDVEVRTLLVDAISTEPAVPPFRIRSLQREEAYAEKIRAALTRRGAAIRDLFDLDHAVCNKDIDLSVSDFWRLVAAKIALPGNEIQPLRDSGRLESLKMQVQTDLRPVLRPVDFDKFDFDASIETLETIERKVREMMASRGTSGPSNQ